MNTQKMNLLWAAMLLGAQACGGDSFQEGQRLYEAQCANCHMSDGSGLGELIPPLAKADFLQQSGATVACLIRNGVRGKMLVNGVLYENEMPAHPTLSAVEIQNIANYIHNAWGNRHAFISLPEIEEALRRCATAQ